MEVINISKRAPMQVGALLKKGSVIICPTDTVYGFLADATNKKAVDNIFKLKKRPKSKPLSVFVKDLKMAKELAEIDEKHLKMLKKYWPGAYTFILKRKTKSLTNIQAYKNVRLFGLDKKTIALRIPKHAFLRKLLKEVNRPLAQTSVNISTQEPLNSPEQIIATFGPSFAEASAGRGKPLVGLIIDACLPAGRVGDIRNPSKRSGQAPKASKIVDLTGEKRVQLR